MRLKFKRVTDVKSVSRLKKKVRIRKTVKGSAERPRLCVFRSKKHIYAQIIDDQSGATLLSFSSLVSDHKLSGKDLAKFVGSEIAKKALSKDIRAVVFDRNGYLYHGRVQSLAEGARDAGLDF